MKSKSIQAVFHDSINWLRDTGTLEKLNDMEYARLKSDKTWLRGKGWFEKFKRTKTSYEEFRAPVHEYNPKVRVDQPLSIYQLAPAFMFLGFGITVSLIGFGVEFCRHEGAEKLSRDVMKLLKDVGYFLLKAPRQLIFWSLIESHPPDSP